MATETVRVPQKSSPSEPSKFVQFWIMVWHVIKEWIRPSKVTWYSWKKTWHDSWITFVAILLSGAVLIGADFLFGYLIRLAMGG